MTRPFHLMLAIVALAAQPAVADGLRPSEMARANDAQGRALRSAIPKVPEAGDWLTRLSGVASPVETVEVNGRTWIAGFVCKPKDCRANRFVFLVAPDGSRASGLVRLTPEGDEPREIETGNPGLLEAYDLRQRLDR